MLKSKNTYSYPIDPNDIIRITYDESPAHVNHLKYSVDFIVPEGTAVRAAADGAVVDIRSRFDFGGEDRAYDPYGNFVEIKHPHGEYSEYEHLRKDGVTVNIGDNVKRGQIIGYSGKTGWIAHLGPHLHFMVYYYRTEWDYQTKKIVWLHKTK